ncbi:MAG: IclR family transcriptional regulator [Burkholderiaceae bacterium]|nr:IclR family transcriptional regulator [Burkholderiaceae bacterium]
MHSEHPFSEPLPEEAAPRTSRGIQSVEVGGQLLKALVHTGRPMALKDLAREAGMTAAKAHPYLVSFGKLGLIEQDPGTGHYGLGSLAMQLGLISLQQKDPVRMAIAELPGLALRVGATVAISVWGNHGPTIIQVEQGPADVHVTMRHGTTASVRYTANGKLFAAFMPRAQVEQALAHDGDPQALQDPLFAQELTAIRQHGISTVREGLVRGIGAVAAPVFDGFGRLVLCLTAIGPVATLDVRVEGAAAQQLRETAQALSRRLGASGPGPLGELVPR